MKKVVNIIINKVEDVCNKIKVQKVKKNNGVDLIRKIRRYNELELVRKLMGNIKLGVRKLCSINCRWDKLALAGVILCGAISLSVAGYKFSAESIKVSEDSLIQNAKACQDKGFKTNTIKAKELKAKGFNANEEEEVKSDTQYIKEEDIERVHATYKFDVTNIKNVVADSDYTFVAKVDKVVSTVYKFPVKIDNKWIKVPYTKYRLKILKNIKGKLKEGGYVEIQKSGGRIQNSSKYMVYDKDTLPSKNAVYIFSAYVQNDGSLLSTGRNSTIRIVSNYKKSVMYNKFVQARNSKTTSYRPRYRIKTSKVYK
ncbi:MAG: hypothetical protein E7262_05395 [Lachnospiraceae bacterium]|nr:hypothetical protein [Lachnospiraceae bacterium]